RRQCLRCQPDQVASGPGGRWLEFPRRRECEWHYQLGGCRTGQIQSRHGAASLTAEQAVAASLLATSKRGEGGCEAQGGSSSPLSANGRTRPVASSMPKGRAIVAAACCQRPSK